MNNMNKSIEFDFNKFSNKLLCVKALKDIFGFGLKEAKEIVDSRRYSYDLSHCSDRNEAINCYDKVGSVYILTEEEYNHLHKCHSLLMDMLGTYKQFLQAYESFK